MRPDHPRDSDPQALDEQLSPTRPHLSAIDGDLEVRGFELKALKDVEQCTRPKQTPPALKIWRLTDTFHALLSLLCQKAAGATRWRS